ncbi:hypothetical protein EYZ11_002293 [Aspergillus tanneri]|uniref:Trafficking protein particle complex subunit 11 domain-containing protein n=1 Tax=Aspergillus tanneri TaxID=1220188 RepID=A0A4S3JU43_9EURO|nr:hypothetical protein EYZ11_002293 [Aspergillus tanneri]
MDAYPEDYVVNNLPFILLSGLEASSEDDLQPRGVDYPLLHEKGARIYSDFPPLNGPIAKELREMLLEEDASEIPWKPRDSAHTGLPRIKYKIKSVGRTYRLPPRKANPPPVSPPTSPTAGQGDDIPHASSLILHSPISPLTPSSPTFPDGLLTPLWVTKHQNLIPAAVINFFPFCLDHNMSSLRDNQMKIEINGLKNEWSASGYKTRFIVVLLSEDFPGGYIGDADDRLASIRRATNLDQKSIFLLPADATSMELKEFTTSLLSLLQPSIMEYYRDLSKHARRKRNRSTIPPPTAPPTSGTSQTLSLQGWNVRYEFKMGIFAEFRHEVDAALRNYENAYDTLFGQEVFENIAGWNPRFNDARLLGDTIAIRIIRCLLCSGQTTAAVRSWVGHRTHVQDIVNRRGKGTRNYGWEAWEARWSMVMAQLIRQAGLPHFSSVGVPQDQFNEQYSIFIAQERAATLADAVTPWEHLHHEGYWLYRSAKHSMYRRTLAEQIPDEDRIPPGQSPASQIASKSYLYDTYLAPESHVEAPQPGSIGFDHSALILDALKAALAEFSKRNQTRKTESLSLEIAEEYMRIGSWTEAYDILKPLWPVLTWRRSNWWQLMSKFGWALRESALRMHDSEMVLRVDWELLNSVFQPKSDWQYDIHQSLSDFPLEKPKPSVVLKAEDVLSSGDETSLHSPTSGLTALVGAADLSLGPSQIKVFDLTCIPREAGDCRVASITLLIEEEKFDLACAVTDMAQSESFWWRQTKKGPSPRRVGKDRDTIRCKIMPKPPKIRITTPNLKDSYYTNERAVLRIGIHNEEDEAADVFTEIRLFGRPESAAKIIWLDEEDSPSPQSSERSSPIEGVSHFIKRSIGVMESSSQRELAIVLTGTHDTSEYELEISCVYHLASDIQTPIIATMRVVLSITRPFEANYEFLPRLHPLPWPDFFSVKEDVLGDEVTAKPRGLQQRWSLNSKVVSFALEPLVIESVSLVLLGASGGATSHIGSEVAVSPEASEIHPEELRESNFTLDIQKMILGDRRPTALNLALQIKWRRSSAAEDESARDRVTTTTLSIPRFVAPAGEPRVLASVLPSETLSGLIHLDYTLENPSMHFLTFNLTMEASEHFAFSGPKTMVVQLVPLSRHTVRYNLLASQRGLWIQPQLLVVDNYFNKTLRVLPTEEMGSDKKGILVWVNADD